MRLIVRRDAGKRNGGRGLRKLSAFGLPLFFW